MDASRKPVLVPFLLLHLLCAAPPGAGAQEGSGGLSIEILKPGIEDTEMLNGAVFLGYTRTLSARYTLDVRLPLARFDKDSSLLDEAEVLVGNPYVGAIRHLDDSPVYFTAGLRLPIASADRPFARVMGEYSDLTRAGAFLPEAFVFNGSVGYGGTLEGGLQYWGGAGPLLTLPSGGEGDAAVYVAFQVSTLYPVGERVRLGAGLSGLYLLTGDSATFHDQALQGIAGAEYDLGPVRPGLTLRLPLTGSWGDAVDGILGLHLAVPLP